MPTSTGSPTASTEAIRASFPALGRTHAGYPVAYFDGPGGTQVPRQVIEATTDYLIHHNANTHWAYPSSEETDEALFAARAALADYLGATPGEIAFGSNMTTLTFHLARAIGRTLCPDDEIIVTELDHQANVAPWTTLAAERGVTIRTVPMVPETGTLDWEQFEALVNERTRLVAIGAASNALGTVNDVQAAARLAHGADAQIFVDAVHFAAHELVDVRAFDCDFLACSAYKFYGPHVGVLFGRTHLLAELDVPKLAPAPDTVPERIETGTLNHEGIVGAAAAVDYLADLSEGATRRLRLQHTMSTLHARGALQLRRMWDGLAEIPGVSLFGPAPTEPRTATLSFRLAGFDSETVVRHLANRFGVFASNGDFYASVLVQRLGFAEEGLVRAGCACYTTEEEVDRLVEGVRSLVR